MALRRTVRRIGALLAKCRADGVSAVAGQLRDRFDKLDFVQFGLRRAIAPLRVRHRCGPRSIAGGRSDPVVFCLVRNGMPWLAAFLAHHNAMGFRHFVVLDNGSDDGTLESLAAMQDVTVLTSAAPYSAYENTLKRYLVDRFGRNRWCLFVDIDEQFDFPLSDQIGLASFIDYLEQNEYDAVITQMLDMFSDMALSRLQTTGIEDFGPLFPYYDVSDIRMTPYPFAAAGPIKMHWGGIRTRLFGTDNGLTKVSFFLNRKGLAPFYQWHHVRSAAIADVSAVLLHYPFNESFQSKVEDAIATGRYGYRTTDEYRAYGERVAVEDLAISSAARREYTSAAGLLESNFLVASERYRAFVQSRAGDAGEGKANAEGGAA